jgi:transposase InsO family protein
MGLPYGKSSPQDVLAKAERDLDRLEQAEWCQDPRRDVTLRALKRAIALRQPKPGLIFHSDRGIEYCAYDYQTFLRSRGIVPSMNRPRNCQDNAHMESFFHSLKAELTHQGSFTSDAHLNAALADYIDRFYNLALVP